MSQQVATGQKSRGVDELVDRLDAAVRLPDCEAITHAVKDVLEEMIQTGSLRMADLYRQTRSDGYARRLLYRDPDDRYTAVVMTWAPNQHTPLHDHAGIWCVEGVVEGRMNVIQYDLIERNGTSCRFAEKGHVLAAVGEAGCLIPPFEYHVLGNALGDRPSITLHIYGGEMDHCHVFEQMSDGRYERKQRALSYHD